MRSADRIAGAALLAFALAFSVAALKNHTYWGENGPGPAFMPFWLGLVMAVLSALLLIGALRSKDRGEAWLPSGDGLRRLVLVLGATVAFVALLSVLGMALGTALFIGVLMRRLERHPWPLTLAVALGVAGLNYLVFTLWLRVPFPVGVLGF
ncbi:MAG: tripartite tricarboxylate transporter TctB family protein [Rubrivivax sp.]|nr:tripartite tricarboxylate transporter TctB family protein [Rubrivivax sp.]MDP3082478.1 tripartite tricarboxylate transporter TctB family protein [Rubrivivax sp.]